MRLFPILPAAMLPLAAMSCGTSVPADPFAGIPGVTYDYYRVTGASAAEICRSIDSQRPFDPIEGKSFDATTQWRIAWHWDGDGAGGCKLDQARGTFAVTVRLPQLDASGVAPAVIRKWRRYDAALRAHEAGHARYAYSRYEDVIAAVRGATCASANAAGHAVLDQIRQHNRAYDRATAHGYRTGAMFPAADQP
ncbi:DUF922 domain-containing protein [Sphingomonas sp. MMS12-HWE2-04]|uniref:DUF922 domain-containing protein n=1 Tax=Sphingomonas sp. MMS12-HWE2-04 TaxID=3234199 RepID=UPI00384A9E12